MRHGARSEARMPTALQHANWTVGLGTTLNPGVCARCYGSHFLNGADAMNFVNVGSCAKLSLVNS